jgi:nifR3 family TIM-barrel protein
MRPPAFWIGGVRVDPPIIQAPMSSLTTLPMRTLSEEQGCGLTITEFLPAIALAAGNKKMLSKVTASAGGRPFGVQIFGRDPDDMRAAARVAVERGAAIVDINMGCPARKVTKGACGSALMREPRLARELVLAVGDVCGGRAEVTVKIRTGWDSENKNAPEFAEAMVEAGAKAIVVHGRTREQKFDGVCDLETIAAVKRRVSSVPVIANGDVTDIPSLERTLAVTGCDGVAVGRAALGYPWIFAQFSAWCSGQPIPSAPTDAERVEMYFRHLDLYLLQADERRAVIEMRKFAGWYLKGLAGAAKVRQAINSLTDVREIRKLLASHLHCADRAA